MSFLTLTESAKFHTDPLRSGIVEIFPRSSAVLERLPFKPITGAAETYDLESTLPGIAFRGINEDYSPSIGVIQQASEPLKMLGGEIKIDRFQIRQQGNGENDVVSYQLTREAKARALFFTKHFFKGDSTANPKGFDGLEKRLSGPQLLKASATAGGAPLTLAMLDDLIDAVHGTGPDVLFMSKTMRRKVSSLVRAAGQAMETVSDAFGRQLQAYAGIPIAIIEEDNEGNPIFDFNEKDGTGAAASCSSIYAVKFGPEYCYGIHGGDPDAKGQGERGNFRIWNMDWYASFCILHPKAAARLSAIKNA